MGIGWKLCRVGEKREIPFWLHVGEERECSGARL
jgi:hypothetical protein